jgi:hypothetical protein
MDRDGMEQQSRAAMEFARALAGDDRQALMQAYLAALNLADQLREGVGADRGAALTRGIAGDAVGADAVGGALRTAPPTGELGSALYADEAWLENALYVIEADTRVIGGVPTPDFDDCVAVGTANGWCCTGTLVAPNVVVTAAHCDREGCPGERVFIGRDIDRPQEGRIVSVAARAVHPDYARRRPYADVMVLILDEDVTGVAPRAIAPSDGLRDEASIRVVGYGRVDVAGTMGYGVRRLVDVPLVSPELAVGQEAGTEFAAGRPFLEKDSCSGDSGGPAYVERDGSWLLMGATSRAIPGRRTCGDGGIYTSVPAHADWVRSADGGHWKL